MNFNDFNLEKCADGLLPVIIQDAVTLRVLMLGYMNREAFDLTCPSGHVTFLQPHPFLPVDQRRDERSLP